MMRCFSWSLQKPLYCWPEHFWSNFKALSLVLLSSCTTRLRSHTKLTNFPGKSRHSTRVSFTGSLSIYTGQRHIFSYVHTRILLGLIVRYVSKQTTHRNQQNNFTRTQITVTTTKNNNDNADEEDGDGDDNNIGKAMIYADDMMCCDFICDCRITSSNPREVSMGLVCERKWLLCELCFWPSIGSEVKSTTMHKEWLIEQSLC